MIPTIRTRPYRSFLLKWRRKNATSEMDHFLFPCSSSSSLFSTQDVVTESRRRQILTAERPFSALDRQVRAKAITIRHEHQLVDIKHRLPILDEEEWRMYLSTLATLNMPDYMRFGCDQTENLRILIEKIAPFCERLAPIDFCNYLRFIDTFDVENDVKDHLAWEREVPFSISTWFFNRYDSIERGAFFEILKLKTKFFKRNSLLFRSETVEELVKCLAHGVHLLKNPESDICDCLEMLFLLQVFGRTAAWENSKSLIGPTLNCLAAKDLPNSLDDCYNSLQFICDGNPRKKQALITLEFALSRHARWNKAAWQWLRNSIELAFEDDNFEHLRPLAAAAAVRAYVFKAADFSREEVNRFLSIAADPFLTNPAIIFEPQKSETPLPNRRMAFGHLIFAVYAAVHNSDLRESLTVRLDDAYWSRFFRVMWEEVAKITGPEGAALFREVRSALYSPNALKVRRWQREYFESPINASREDQLDCMKKKFQFDVFSVIVGDVMVEDLTMLMQERMLAAVNKG